MAAPPAASFPSRSGEAPRRWRNSRTRSSSQPLAGWALEYPGGGLRPLRQRSPFEAIEGRFPKQRGRLHQEPGWRALQSSEAAAAEPAILEIPKHFDQALLRAHRQHADGGPKDAGAREDADQRVDRRAVHLAP